MVNGPWSVLFKQAGKAAKATGKKMGNQVKKDVEAAEIKISHKNDYTDLVKDKGLSPDWIHGLIERSRNPEQIGKVVKYMTDGDKTANLALSSKKFLFKKLMARLNELDSQAVAKFAEHQDKMKKVLSIIEDFIT